MICRRTHVLKNIYVVCTLFSGADQIEIKVIKQGRSNHSLSNKGIKISKYSESLGFYYSLEIYVEGVTIAKLFIQLSSKYIFTFIYFALTIGVKLFPFGPLLFMIG